MSLISDLDRPTEEMPPFILSEEEAMLEWKDASPEDVSPTEPNQTDRMIGVHLHGLRIEQFIGEGSAARIYLGAHRVLDREFAVKIMHDESVENQELIERMKREARVLSRIDHPNIVRVYDFGETECGQPFIAMEMLRGKTLKVLIETEAPLPHDRILAITKQIAAGLEEAHENGLVHRDLKPENIMLVGEGDQEVVKILDFGLARETIVARAAAGPSPPLTGIDILLGTPRYMAPEQILAPSNAGPGSDLYALGIMIYEMLTGKPLFSGAVFEVIEQQLNRVPDPLGKRGALERIMTALLAKDPAVRPSSADEVRAMLDDATPDRSSTIVRRPPSAPVAVSIAPKKPGWLIPVLTVVLMLVGFSLVGAAGYALGSRQSYPHPMKHALSPR
jgi:eukaryotic-like serine/threonine-protein kinase